MFQNWRDDLTAKTRDLQFLAFWYLCGWHSLSYVKLKITRID